MLTCCSSYFNFTVAIHEVQCTVLLKSPNDLLVIDILCNLDGRMQYGHILRIIKFYATWSNVFLTFSVFNFGFYKFHEFVNYKSWFKRKNLC